MKMHECLECDYKTEKIQNWNHHCNSVLHRERPSLPVIKTCKDCNKEFRDIENYFNHRLFALCEHPKCDYCNKFFSSKQGLRYHLKTSKKCCVNTHKTHFKNGNCEIFRKAAINEMVKDACPEAKYLCRDWIISKFREN